MQAKNLADLHGLLLLDWSAVEAQLDAGTTQAPGWGGPDRHPGGWPPSTTTALRM